MKPDPEKVKMVDLAFARIIKACPSKDPEQMSRLVWEMYGHRPKLMIALFCRIKGETNASH